MARRWRGSSSCRVTADISNPKAGVPKVGEPICNLAAAFCPSQHALSVSEPADSLFPAPSQCLCGEVSVYITHSYFHVSRLVSLPGHFLPPSIFSLMPFQASSVNCFLTQDTTMAHKTNSSSLAFFKPALHLPGHLLLSRPQEEKTGLCLQDPAPLTPQ